MRFIFCVRPYLGHLHPMVPVAASLVGNGNEVCFASAAAFAGAIEMLGFPAVAAGHDPRSPVPDAVAACGGAYGTWVTRRKIEDLLRLCESWRPAAIVRDPTDFAALLAAEVLRLPRVTLGFAQFYPRSTWREQVGATLDALRDEYDLPPDPDCDRVHSVLYLDTVPPRFQPPGVELPQSAVSIRPEPAECHDDAELIRLFGGPPPRPLIYATLGTFFNQNRNFFEVIAEAFVGSPVNVICTVGPDAAPDEVLPDPPKNMRVTSYIPQAAVHAHCDAVVSHGGFSTVVGALCAGIPVVAVPHGADHPGNARRAKELGAGVVVDRAGLTAASVRAAVLEVLREPRYQIAARAFRAHVEQLPGPDHGARLLSELPELLVAEADVRARSEALIRELS